LLNWIRNFLSGHTHTTRVGNVVSEPLDLCSGTIQGSGIGPLLFIAYINELADVLSEYKVTVKIFADNLKLYAVLATDIDVSNFNSALKCIEEWANTWQLQLSVENAVFLRLTSYTVLALLFPYCLNGVSLPTTNIVKDLGITVNDSSLPALTLPKSLLQLTSVLI